MWTVAAAMGALAAQPPARTAPAAERVAETVDIARVWAGHPVGFALLTHGRRQFAAFYDAERRMTVAAREVGATNWQFQTLPTAVGWDSHNYITMAVDASNHLHVSGNMHVAPLIYFRTERPLDIASLVRVPAMTGDRETRCTYPVFLRGPKDELIFTYRDGHSGSGDQVLNVYDPATRAWRRLMDTPLTAGGGKMNAYFVGPVRGPDGTFHLCWVWRDHPGCESNHDLSYARSRDLVHWTKSDGTPLATPITVATAEIVDPVPAGGGMINGNTKIGFDTRGRVILSYHKHDGSGKTQLYNARLEDGRWKIRQASDWDYRWDFAGGGTMRFEIQVGSIEAGADGRLTQGYSHAKYGSGLWELDEATLKPTGRAARPPSPFRDADRTRGPLAEGLEGRSASDLGRPDEPGVRYVMRWATLPSNRDRPQTVPVPEPTMLRVYKIVSGN